MMMLSGFATMEGQTGDRQTAAQKYIDIKMKEEPFKTGLVGVLAVTAKGDTIAEFNSPRKLIPASNTKLISTGLAIRGLGPSFRFSTRLGYSGYISNGTLRLDWGEDFLLYKRAQQTIISPKQRKTYVQVPY